MDSKNIETRIKKFKPYRIKIKKDYLLFEKKKQENDDIKIIEKKLKKINPNLIIDKKNINPFSFYDIANQDEYGYINELLVFTTQLENNKYLKLLLDSQNIKNDIDNEPTFDESGNISNQWLKDDAKYEDLLVIKEWIINSDKNFLKFEAEIKKKLFEFKDVIYKTKNNDIINELLKPNVKLLKLKKKKDYLLIFTLAKYSLFVISILIILGIALFFIKY